MKFLVLMTETDPEAWDRATEAEREAVFAEHTAFDEAVSARATMLGGQALAGVAEATTSRGSQGADVGHQRAWTAGPYAETAEQLGGFYLVGAADLATVQDLCGLLPPGYTLEVRPVIEIEGYEG